MSNTRKHGHKRRNETTEATPNTGFSMRLTLQQTNADSAAADSKAASAGEVLEAKFENFLYFSRITFLHSPPEEENKFWVYKVNVEFADGNTVDVMADNGIIDVRGPFIAKKRKKHNSTAATASVEVSPRVQVNLLARHMQYDTSQKRSKCLQEFKGDITLNLEDTREQSQTISATATVTAGLAALAAQHGLLRNSASTPPLTCTALEEDNHKYCFGAATCSGYK